MSDDLISRQAAIDAILHNQEVYSNNFGNDPIDKYTIAIIDNDAQTIAQLPSAQPEQRWNPVTELLPAIDMSYPHHEDYLVQYDSGDMDVASWSNVNRFWTDHVTKPYWNCVQFAEVIAWRELPEPWKGEDDE